MNRLSQVTVTCVYKVVVVTNIFGLCVFETWKLVYYSLYSVILYY